MLGLDLNAATPMENLLRLRLRLQLTPAARTSGVDHGLLCGPGQDAAVDDVSRYQ